MFDQNSYALSRIWGPDDPRIIALNFAAQNPTMKDSISGLLNAMAYNDRIDPANPPNFPFATDLVSGELRVGRVKVGNVLCQPVGLASEGQSPGHTAIIGKSGKGKSFLAKYIAWQAINRGDKVLSLVRHHEWRDFLALFQPGQVLFMEPGQLGINVLQIPKLASGLPSMSPLDWIMELKVQFRASLFLRDVSSNMLGRAIMGIYKNKGILDGGCNWPCLSELRSFISSMSLGSGKRLSEARDTLLDRLDMLIAFLEGLDVVISRDVQKLFSHSIVLDVSNVCEVAYIFLFNFLTAVLRAAFPQEC